MVREKEKACHGIYDWFQSHFWIIFVGLTIAGALASRIGGLGFKSPDYEYFLKHWYQHFATYGFSGFSTIYSQTDANYPPLYLIIMATVAQLPHPTEFCILSWIKAPQILVDFILAYGVYKFVWSFREEKKWGILAAAAFLLAPLPLLNSGVWMQADVLYSCAAVWAAYLLFKERYPASFWLLGTALALKPHTIFLFPIFILVAFHKKFNPLYFMIIPLPHLAVSAFVSALWGAPFIRTLTILGAQSQGLLSRNAPNLSAFFNSSGVNTAGFIWLLTLTIVSCAILFYLFLQRTKSLTLDKFILWCLVTTLTVTCLLPNMHERFFFLPETFSLIYAFMKPKYFYIPLMIHLAALSAYLGYLLHLPIFTQHHAALLMLFALCLLLKILRREDFEETA